MKIEEIEEVISVGLDPNGDTAKFILKKLREQEAALEASRAYGTELKQASIILMQERDDYRREIDKQEAALKQADKIADTIDWCRENDEPVSGYIETSDYRAARNP